MAGLVQSRPGHGRHLGEAGDEKCIYCKQQQLLWKMGAAGARLCLPQGADKFTRAARNARQKDSWPSRYSAQPCQGDGKLLLKGYVWL